MKYIGFKHQMDNKQNSDKLYSTIADLCIIKQNSDKLYSTIADVYIIVIILL